MGYPTDKLNRGFPRQGLWIYPNGKRSWNCDIIDNFHPQLCFQLVGRHTEPIGHRKSELIQNWYIPMYFNSIPTAIGRCRYYSVTQESDGQVTYFRLALDSLQNWLAHLIQLVFNHNFISTHRTINTLDLTWAFFKLETHYFKTLDIDRQQKSLGKEHH